jgi:hypothetical protein
MSLSPSYPHLLVRPTKNRFMRERSCFVSSWKKHADLRELSFHQASVSDTNSIPVQAKRRLVPLP